MKRSPMMGAVPSATRALTEPSVVESVKAVVTQQPRACGRGERARAGFCPDPSRPFRVRVTEPKQKHQ
ncbi:hypothetical protein chiPu_0000104 [Chiloscyllium punctatum]|uniref:Uncharacterized protein n=1 Tax=Chiloscyllium punctatum TaxID=137246 RepID=A0A401RS10_CHIPU|nr:hypothetical protein [Chiloscyllium punctatum]